MKADDKILKENDLFSPHESIIMLTETEADIFVEKAMAKPDKNLEELILEFTLSGFSIKKNCTLLAITYFPTKHIKDIIRRLRKILANITSPEVKKNTLCQLAREELEQVIPITIQNLESRLKEEKSKKSEK